MRSGWSRIADWRSKRRERAEAAVTRLRPISPWLLFLAVVVIVAITWPLTRWLYGIAGDDPARRIEAIKTGLTVAAGTGGAFALLLAFRRQLATEIIAAETREAREREHEQRDRTADASERDAEQRRITELYTRAVDQLGNDQAPVRLGGLHALERLAQITPDQRQTIVDVICAYLRMPFALPEGKPPGEDAPAEAHTRYEQRRQELQVRLTAQRILAAHLRLNADQGRDAVETFWPDIDLDLTEAQLHKLDLAMCRIKDAQFSRAQFSGGAAFIGTQFSGQAWFGKAQFSGEANFVNAQFSVETSFGRAQFSGDARFVRAQFRTSGYMWFDGVHVSGGVGFVGAEFSGQANFDEAQFSGQANFDRARFSEDARFDRARARPAEDRAHSWPATWSTREACEGEEDGWLYLVRVEE